MQLAHAYPLFHIAYIAIGLGVQQSAWQHRFTLILCYFLIKEKVREIFSVSFLFGNATLDMLFRRVVIPSKKISILIWVPRCKTGSFDQWKGDNYQIDDFAMLGLRI